MPSSFRRILASSTPCCEVDREWEFLGRQIGIKWGGRSGCGFMWVGGVVLGSSHMYATTKVYVVSLFMGFWRPTYLIWFIGWPIVSKRRTCGWLQFIILCQNVECICAAVKHQVVRISLIGLSPRDLCLCVRFVYQICVFCRWTQVSEDDCDCIIYLSHRNLSVTA